MAKRNYTKRTKSTASKTYQDYLNKRSELLSKGYTLQEQMSKESFEAAYERIKIAKKAGEIKSSAWQYLTKKEKYVSDKQAKALAKAASVMNGVEVKAIAIKRMSEAEIVTIGNYLNIHKYEDDLFGGNYE